MACVCQHCTVPLIHGPVIGQAIDVVVFRLIFRGGGLMDVAVDVEQAQVVDGSVQGAGT